MDPRQDRRPGRRHRPRRVPRLDPHPDVEPAPRMLHDAGIPAVTLTNGSAELVGALLDRAGLHGLVRRSLSVDDVHRWKPAAEPYRWAVQQLGAEPGQVALVACHPWDCAGAHTAGLTSGWVNRAGVARPTAFSPPDAAGCDLTPCSPGCSTPTTLASGDDRFGWVVRHGLRAQIKNADRTGARATRSETASKILRGRIRDEVAFACHRQWVRQGNGRADSDVGRKKVRPGCPEPGDRSDQGARPPRAPEGRATR